MKTLTKILIIISVAIFMFACKPTAEEKMLKSLQTEQFGKNIKILSIDIVDTLYDRQVVDTLEFDRIMVQQSEEKIKRMYEHKDSMFRHRMQYSKERMDSFRKMSVMQIREMERMRDFHDMRTWRMQNLQLTGRDSDIAIYDVLVLTPTDTMEFYISKNFRVLGPKFMFTNEDVRPMERRRRPEAFGPRSQNPRSMGKPSDQGRRGHPSPSDTVNRLPLR